MLSTWRDEDKVREYIGRIGRLEARRAGERELAEALPDDVERVLDLGCGDGALIRVALAARPSLAEAVGLDSSEPMLRLANDFFRGESYVTLLAHDLSERLPDLGCFDAVISGFAIHHLSHARKRSLLQEVASVLRPGGVFANLEVVECATPQLQEEFYRRIERPGGDPEDVLADVESQLAWMRLAGLEHVDCYWRWRGFALLVGHAAETVP